MVAKEHSTGSAGSAGSTGGFDRRRIVQWALAGGASLTAGGVLAACGPGTGGPGQAIQGQVIGQPVRGGHLTMAMNGQVKRWDPAISLVIDEIVATQAVYNNLTRLDHQYKVHPDLAESWTFSPDLKTWTFKLRKGVVFHHGKPFTADDVVYTFKRIMDPATKSATRTQLSYLDAIEKVDDHTVVFRLNQPTTNVPSDFAWYHPRIVASDWTEEQIASRPSGTGPFKLKEWSPGERTVFTRNEQYFEPGLPHLDGWTIVSMPEETSRVAALTSGAVDVIWQLDAQSVPAVQGHPNVLLLRGPSGGYQPIVMKTDMAPFTDLRVRQAFKLLADRATFVQAVTQGYGQPGADHPIPTFMLPQLEKEVPVPRPDVARAKQLLADAGFPSGLDLTMWTSEGRAGMVESAVTFQEMARPAGVRLTIQKVPISTYWEEIWMKKELLTGNWVGRPSIDLILSSAYQSNATWNEAAFKSAELDRLMIGARAEPDEAKRAALYVRVAKILQAEGGSIIPYFRDVIAATTSKVQNYFVHPSTLVDVRSVWKVR